MADRLPVVAIVGRPNVGKSSLYNLLVGEARSIVDEMEGVTRDIVIARVTTDRVSFNLYDTAGYLEEGDEFNALVQRKVRVAIGDADLILFIVDGRSLHPFDEELARILLRQKKKVILIANKLDTRDLEIHASEFYNLGFEEIMPFSVLHKRGYTTLLERIEDLLGDAEKRLAEAEEEVRVAIVGKPNVGKSQLLNTLLGYDRSIVSPVPGTTRDSIDDTIRWNGKLVRLIDTAGLRRQARIDENVEYYSNVRTVQAVERSDVVVLLLDATESISMQDKRIVELVMRKGRGLVVAFNKWDLRKAAGDENYFVQEEVRKSFHEELPSYPFLPVEFISARDGYKLQRLVETVFHVYHDFHYRVPTGDLNAWVKQEVRESDEEKPISDLKVYYATQVYAAPPGFIFFINSLKHMRKDFPRYLENRLRTVFEFSGVPMKILFREKERDKNKEDGGEKSKAFVGKGRTYRKKKKY